VHNWLRKRPYALCKSCRGSRDLQLWYSSVCPLQFNFLEKNRVKACPFELFWLLALQSARWRHASPRGSPRPARRGTPATVSSPGPRTDVRAPMHRRHAPHPHRPGTTALSRPLIAIGQPRRPWPPSQSRRRRTPRHAMTMPSWWTCEPPLHLTRGYKRPLLLSSRVTELPPSAMAVTSVDIVSRSFPRLSKAVKLLLRSP
jgi:hypothetical protein